MYAGQVGQVFGYLQRRLGGAAAEELTAQAFEEAWRLRERFDPSRGSPGAWLFGIALNLMRRHYREETRQLRAFAASGVDPLSCPDDAARVVDRLDADDQWQQVAAALGSMRATDRDILTLACWEEMSYEEIATTLGVPVGTVRSRLSRARARLATTVRSTGRGQEG